MMEYIGFIMITIFYLVILATYHFSPIFFMIIFDLQEVTYKGCTHIMNTTHYATNCQEKEVIPK